MSVYDFNAETAEEHAARRQRAQALTSGKRGADGRTDAERALLADLRRLSNEFRRVYGENERAAGRYA